MHIRRQHHLGLEDAKVRMEEVAHEVAARHGLVHSWQGDHLQFSGRGINGTILMDEHWIEINVKLGLALMMLEPIIRAEILKAMDEHLVT